MKKAAQIAERIRKLRKEVRGETQEQFAKHFKVEAATISGWERGKDAYTPGTDAYVKLARLAPYPDNFWFLEQAGVDVPTILSTSEKARSRKTAPGEIISVPVFRVASGGEIVMEEAALPLPSELVSKPASTICFVNDTAVEHELAGRGFVVVDVSDNNSKTLMPFWGQIVLVQFFPSLKRTADLHWEVSRPQSGLGVGVLRHRTFDKGVDWIAFIGASREGHGTAVWPATVGAWKCPSLPRNPAKAERQARKMIKLFEGCRILGRVIGWFDRAEARKHE